MKNIPMIRILFALTIGLSSLATANIDDNRVLDKRSETSTDTSSSLKKSPKQNSKNLSSPKFFTMGSTRNDVFSVQGG